MDENTLWNKVQKNDTQAFKKIFGLYYTSLCTYILQFTNDRTNAEDIVQDTFIKLWDKRNTIQINTSLKSYLFRSAHNAYVDTFRKRKQHESLLEKLKYDALISQLDENNFIHHQKIEKIKVVIETLPKRCKEILLLSKQKGLKNKEIATILGISIKTVEAQLSIAFQKIRKGI
ncbi:MAG TPA: RNA polymerase sigma-70 factor [Flavobacteriia bacterium]|nr:RNA polymerase sigma-70 factor [Flavobacteriia bacterium]